MRKFIITEQTLSATLQYLHKMPYEQVHQLISALGGCALVEEKPAEKPANKPAEKPAKKQAEVK